MKILNTTASLCVIPQMDLEHNKKQLARWQQKLLEKELQCTKLKLASEASK